MRRLALVYISFLTRTIEKALKKQSKAALACLTALKNQLNRALLTGQKSNLELNMLQNKVHLDVNIFKPNILTAMYEIKANSLISGYKLEIRF